MMSFKTDMQLPVNISLLNKNKAVYKWGRGVNFPLFVEYPHENGFSEKFNFFQKLLNDLFARQVFKREERDVAYER